MKQAMLAGVLLSIALGASIPSEAQQVARTKPTTSTCSVTNSSTACLAANDNRNFLMLQNDDAALVVYCAVGATATINNGIRVNAVGTTVIFSPVVPVGAFNCITTAAGPAKLLVTEGANQ